MTADPRQELSPAERALIDAARAFTREHVRPAAAGWERAGRIDTALFRRAGELGLTLLLLPEAAGGAGCAPLAAARVAAELAAGSLALALPLVAHNYVAWSIADYGSEALRRRHLPAMLRGERTGIFSLTEPQGGSDAAAVRTTAARDGGGWTLTGEKAWVTLAADADFFIVYAQTEPGSGARGIALFLVEGDVPGLERLPPYRMLGGNALGLGGLRLERVRVPGEHLLAPPGEGLRYAFKAIDWARAMVGAMVCGMLRQCLDEAVAYTAGHRLFGHPSAEFQAVQFLLADVATDLEAAAQLSDAAVRALAAGDPAATVLAAHAKKLATRTALGRIADCMQVMGANGMRDEHSLARHFTAAKAAQYLDGATEIQNVVISRALLRPHGVRVG